MAAATRVRMDDARLVKAQLVKREQWQDDAWDFFDLVPEVKQLTWLLGNLISKARLFVAVQPDDPDADPIPVTDEASGIPPEVAARATAELDRLGKGLGGHSAILRALNMNLEIAAEGHLIGRSARPEVVNDKGVVIVPAEPESWTVRSIREVEAKASTLPNGRKSTVVVKDGPDDKGVPLDPVLDTSIRFWQQHPMWGKRADCAMRACLDDCETLVILKQQLRAEARSHVPAGFLFASKDLEWATGPQTIPPADGDEATGPVMHPLMAQLVETLTEAIEDPSSAGSLAPMLGLLPVGQGEDIRTKVMHLSLARTTGDTLDQRITARVHTLARGLNAPFEVVVGHQSTTFANADQISEDKYKDHAEPRLTMIADILTVGFLRPNLLDEPFEDDDEPAPIGAPPPLEPVDVALVDRMFVWYDPANLIAQPDPTEGADNAHDRNTISDEAYRRLRGYDEDDAPNPIELLVRAALKGGALSPEVTVALLELLGQPIDVQPLPGAPPMNGARSKPIVTSARQLTAAAGVPRSAGRRFMEIDRELRSRLLVLADRTMTRALERAGAVLRTKSPAAMRRAIDGVPNTHVAAAMGRAAVTASGADVDEILGEVFDSMEPAFMSWGANSQRAALNLAHKVSSGFSTAERDVLQLRQADDLAMAWTWMRETMTSLAHARLFDPTSAAQVLGEVDKNLSVPASLIRQAVTRAGGTTGVKTADGTGAWVALTQGDSGPAGGIGTGEVISGALGEHGVDRESYVWDYGPGVRTHPFEPHEDLDGVEFTSFDDPVLANDESFPPFAFYMPGDHDGCQCDFIPVLGLHVVEGGGEGDSGE